VSDEVLKKLLPPIDIEKYGGAGARAARNAAANGMMKEVLSPPREGGISPGDDSDVEIIFTGWRVQDGELLDSSYLRGGKPERFNLGKVMTGWKVGLKEMKEGERRRLWIPDQFTDGRGDSVYEIELLKVQDGPPWAFLTFIFLAVAGVTLYVKAGNKIVMSELLGY
jgi:hypothetical protein